MTRFLVFLSIIAYIAFFLFVAFARHDNFYSRKIDLGNMDQTAWNILHGNGFTLTDPMGTDQQSRLAIHADFLLILLTPLYLLWSNPKMLLIVQTVVIGLGAIPIFWLARDKLKSPPLGLLFVLVYLLYPPLQRMNFHDFHAVALSGPFLLFAYWYMKRDNLWLFSLFAVLAALGKEDVWLVTGMMGVSLIPSKRHRLFGVGVAAVSFFMFYLLFWVVIPGARATDKHWALQYLSEFGNNQNDVVKNILTQPLSVLSTVFAPNRLFYYFQLLFPLGFFSLLSPLYLVFALPALAINVLSNNDLFRQIDYQYTATITPWIFIAAIRGIAWAKNKLKISTIYLLVYLLLAITCSSYLWGEVPFTSTDRFFYFTWPQPEKVVLQTIEQRLLNHPQYSVSATNNIGAHFSQRPFLYTYPINAQSADYVIIQLGDQYAWPSGDEQKRTYDTLLLNEEYEQIAATGSVSAFKRKTLQ